MTKNNKFILVNKECITFTDLKSDRFSSTNLLLLVRMKLKVRKIGATIIPLAFM